MAKFNRYFASAEDGKTADIYIYGFIGYDDDTETLVKEIAAFSGDKITLHINSCGGSVIDANAIFNAMKAFKGETEAVIEGMAGSAASYLMLSCGKVRAYENATVFIHNPLVEWASGNKKQLEKIADDLEKFEEMYVKAYCEKSGKDENEVRILMDAETLFTAQEAADFGLVDEVIVSTEESGSTAKQTYKFAAKMFAQSFNPFKAKSQEQNQPKSEEIKTEIKDKETLIAALTALKDLEADALKAEIDNIISALDGLEIKQKEEPAQNDETNGGGNGGGDGNEEANAQQLEQLEAKITKSLEAKFEEKLNAVLLGRVGGSAKPEGKTHSEIYNAMKAGAEKTAYFKAHKSAILNNK